MKVQVTVEEEVPAEGEDTTLCVHTMLSADMSAPLPCLATAPLQRLWRPLQHTPSLAPNHPNSRSSSISISISIRCRGQC